MKISFTTQKLQKIFNSEKELVKTFGVIQSKKIKVRIKVLEAAVNLQEVPTNKPERCHQLKGDKKGQFAVDLNNPYRMLFKPDRTPGLLPDGGFDLKTVTGIIILGVEDYHGE